MLIIWLNHQRMLDNTSKSNWQVMLVIIFVVTAKEVKRAKFYSIFANKVTDAVNKELSLVLRYVLISETIVDFLEVELLLDGV